MSRAYAQPWITGFAAIVVGLFTVWPTYGPSPRVASDGAAPFAAQISRGLAETRGTESGLQVGWAVEELTPPPGTPLAGYGDRAGAPATGSKDRLIVAAVALSDGLQTALIFTADLLVVPPNITGAVLAQLPEDTEGVYFTATHTHGGPGASTPGFLARAFGGAYDRKVADAVVDAFVSAARRARNDLGPGGFAAYSFPAPDLIQNRTRSDSATGYLVDDAVQLLSFRRFDEERRLVIARYSAHSTVVGSRTMEYTAGYPGETREAAERLLYARATEEQVCELLPVMQPTVLFAAGAVGSMGPSAPPGATDAERAAAMGEDLGRRIAEAVPVMDLIGYREEIDIRYASSDVRMPPIQLRVLPGVRLSPLAARFLGVWRHGRVSALHIGDARLVGLPVDVSGELAAAWRAESEGRVVVTSFSGGYSGYLSPDAYYGELLDGDELAYETGIMSWTGPRQEEFFHALYKAATAAP